MTNKQIDARFNNILTKIPESSTPKDILDIVKKDLIEEYHNANCRKSSMSLMKDNVQKISRIVMMCPTCFSRKVFDVNFDSGDIEEIRIEAIHGCKDCNCDMVNLDIEIADVIVKLNRRGYITNWSCSGHENPKDHLYVSFKDTSFLYNLLKNNIKFPSSLKIDILEDINNNDDVVVIRGDNKDKELSDFHKLVNEMFKFQREENRYGKTSEAID